MPQFDKFGEPYCFFVEDKSIRDLEKEYHLTAQTRAMWGIPRPGVSLGGVVDDDWGEMPDPYVPEHMSAQQVRPPRLSSPLSLPPLFTARRLALWLWPTESAIRTGIQQLSSATGLGADVEACKGRRPHTGLLPIDA